MRGVIAVAVVVGVARKRFGSFGLVPVGFKTFATLASSSVSTDDNRVALMLPALNDIADEVPASSPLPKYTRFATPTLPAANGVGCLVALPCGARLRLKCSTANLRTFFKLIGFYVNCCYHITSPLLLLFSYFRNTIFCCCCYQASCQLLITCFRKNLGGE